MQLIDGNMVVCDFCSEEYGNSNEEGGLIHNKNWAVCPKCEHKVNTHITLKADKGQTFKSLVNQYRLKQGFIVF